MNFAKSLFTVPFKTFSRSSKLVTCNPPGLKSPNYSYAIKVKPNATMVFASGQVSLDPKTNKFSPDIAEQTKQAMENLKLVLESSGSSMENIVKATIYLTDMANYNSVNSEYRKYFEGKEVPARVCIAVKALPFNVDVEIDAIAVENEK